MCLTVSLPGDGQVSVAGAAEISAAGKKNKKKLIRVLRFIINFFLSLRLPAGGLPGQRNVAGVAKISAAGQKK